MDSQCEKRRPTTTTTPTMIPLVTKIKTSFLTLLSPRHSSNQQNQQDQERIKNKNRIEVPLVVARVDGPSSYSPLFYDTFSSRSTTSSGTLHSEEGGEGVEEDLEFRPDHSSHDELKENRKEERKKVKMGKKMKDVEKTMKRWDEEKRVMDLDNKMDLGLKSMGL